MLFFLLLLISTLRYQHLVQSLGFLVEIGSQMQVKKEPVYCSYQPGELQSLEACQPTVSCHKLLLVGLSCYLSSLTWLNVLQELEKPTVLYVGPVTWIL